MSWTHVDTVNDPGRQSVFTLARSLLRGAWVLWVFAAATHCGGSYSHAQITPEYLLQFDVSDVGTEKEDVTQAITRFYNRDISGAREFLEAAVKTNPKLAPADILLARMLLITGQEAAGRVVLERAIKEHPADPEAYHLLAQLAARDNRVTEAELLNLRVAQYARDFQQNATRRRRLLISAYDGLAAIAESRERWDDAQRYLAAWVHSSLEPDNATAQQRLGRALFELNRSREAYEALKLAHQHNDRLPNAEVTMAEMYVRKGDSGNADKWLKFAQSQSPKKSDVRAIIAQLRLSLGSADQAKTEAEQALKLDPKSLSANTWLGVCARVLGDLDTAELRLTAAHQLSPSSFLVNNHLALTLIEQPDADKKNRALEYAQLNARVFPFQANHATTTGVDSTATLCWVLYRMNRRREAFTLLSPIMNNVASSPDATYLTAKMLLAAGQTKEGVRYLQMAVDGNGFFADRYNAVKLLAKHKNAVEPPQGKGP